MSTISISALERNMVAESVFEDVNRCRKSKGCINCNTCRLSTIIINYEGKCCDVCDIVLSAMSKKSLPTFVITEE